MSKYDALWERIAQNGSDDIELTYGEIEETVGFPIDHSFLKYKKELLRYGYEVVKISMKNQTVIFRRIKP